MTTIHSFFIPDIEYLQDLDGLVSYLREKTTVGAVCLYCERPFSSLEAVQAHMVCIFTLAHTHIICIMNTLGWADKLRKEICLLHVLITIIIISVTCRTAR